MNSILESFKVFYETKILGYINMMVEYPIKLLALAVDLAIVFYLLYKLIKMIKTKKSSNRFMKYIIKIKEDMAIEEYYLN